MSRKRPDSTPDYSGPGARETAEERAAAASYIAAMARELAGIAGTHGFPTLVYLLEMTKMEAESSVRSDGREPG